MLEREGNQLISSTEEGFLFAGEGKVRENKETLDVEREFMILIYNSYMYI